eukprot:TRINITY_DN5781_c0_g1_i1.p1 TRINITY_DN5781_c0_g1~~TRINITY_DN5781_c0_g1_i1.p1  ORF type:complete len:481 (+),score=66.87 TRINITY_DN5781_c0_g1_i1:105-1547(+)
MQQATKPNIKLPKHSQNLYRFSSRSFSSNIGLDCNFRRTSHYSKEMRQMVSTVLKGNNLLLCGPTNITSSKLVEELKDIVNLNLDLTCLSLSLDVGFSFDQKRATSSFWNFIANSLFEPLKNELGIAKVPKISSAKEFSDLTCKYKKKTQKKRIIVFVDGMHLLKMASVETRSSFFQLFQVPEEMSLVGLGTQDVVKMVEESTKVVFKRQMIPSFNSEFEKALNMCNQNSKRPFDPETTSDVPGINEGSFPEKKEQISLDNLKALETIPYKCSGLKTCPFAQNIYRLFKDPNIALYHWLELLGAIKREEYNVTNEPVRPSPLLKEGFSIEKLIYEVIVFNKEKFINVHPNCTKKSKQKTPSEAFISYQIKSTLDAWYGNQIAILPEVKAGDRRKADFLLEIGKKRHVLELMVNGNSTSLKDHMERSIRYTKDLQAASGYLIHYTTSEKFIHFSSPPLSIITVQSIGDVFKFFLNEKPLKF